LLDRGFVARRSAGGDRRFALLRLTPQGQRANRANRGTIEAAVTTALRAVSARDRAATARVLARLAEHLDPDMTTGSARPAPGSRRDRRSTPR
jgi:DNA-binding MarR family transcriptional regulator